MLLLCHLTHNFVPCWPECGEHDPRPHREARGEGLHRGHGARPPGAGGGHQHQQHWHRPRQWGGRSHRASLVIYFFHFHYSILFRNFIIQGCQGATETGKSVECEGGWTYRKTHSIIAKIDEFTGGCSGCSGHGAQFKHWLLTEIYLMCLLCFRRACCVLCWCYCRDPGLALVCSVYRAHRSPSLHFM